MSHEPAGSEVRNLLERARLLEQVRCARDDPQLARARQALHRPAIQRENNVVQAPDDQQGRSPDAFQRVARQVGPPAAGDHGPQAVRHRRRRNERCCGPGARPETADGKAARPLVARQPCSRPHDATRQQVDVEAQRARSLIHQLLVACEQVQQECPQSRRAQPLCDEPVAGRVAAAAAAVGEQDDCGGPRGNTEITGQGGVLEIDDDGHDAARSGRERRPLPDHLVTRLPCPPTAAAAAGGPAGSAAA